MGRYSEDRKDEEGGKFLMKMTTHYKGSEMRTLLDRDGGGGRGMVRQRETQDEQLAWEG